MSLLDFDNLNSIIIHLGMSGRLKILKNKTLIKKHDHLVLNFNNFKLIL